MENKNIDTELKILFQNNKQIIEDNGFSEKVMHNLPQKQKNREWLVLPFAFTGGVVSFILSLHSGLLLRIAQSIYNEPEQFILTLLIVFLAAIAVFVFFERNRSLRFPFD